LTSRIVALVVSTIALAGCASSNPKASQAGYPNGFETEVKMAVALKNAPKAEDATLLTGVDNEIAKTLEAERDAILKKALETYEKERPEEGTKITAENVEVILEDFEVAAEDTAATRKMFEGRVTKFRFTLRRPKARIVPDPTRVEAVVFCIERSWAPGDTTRFPQVFRAEVMDRLNNAIYELAKKQGLDPVKPRSPRTQ
jgi:hypothetical protein